MVKTRTVNKCSLQFLAACGGLSGDSSGDTTVPVNNVPVGLSALLNNARKALLICVMIGLTVSLYACGGGAGGGSGDNSSGDTGDTSAGDTGSDNSGGGSPAVSVVLAESDTLGMLVGDVDANPATPYGSGALSYVSDNEAVATVDANGNVTAVAIGEATITVNQAADADHAASSDSVVVNVIADTFSITLRLGNADTNVDFSAGVDGMAFYRSTDALCDIANYASCTNGRLDILNGMTVTDTAANAYRSAFYTFANGNDTRRYVLGRERLPDLTGNAVATMNGQLYVVAGWTGWNEDGGDDVWVSSDGFGWKQLTANAGFPNRQNFAMTVFNGRLWITGGRGLDEYGYSNVNLNDVWSSSDGITWTQATANGPFAARNRQSLVGFKGKLWLIGGQAINSAPIQDIWSSSDGANWVQEVASLPFDARYVTVFNDRLIAATTKGIWASDDGVNWSELTADTGYNRADGLTVHQGKLWVMNLTADSKSEPWWSTDGISWTREVVDQSYETRYAFGFASFDNRLFMLGGEKLFGARFDDNWYLEDGQWHAASLGAGIPLRQHQAAVAFNGKLWQIGGYGNDGEFNDVYSSSDGMTWTRETAAAEFSARFDHAVVAFNGKLWLYGGAEPSAYPADVWSSSDGVTWTDEVDDPMLAARLDAGVIVFDGKVWMFGGRSQADYSYLNEVWYSSDGTTWTQATTSNFPERADMGLLVHDGKLWAIGGRDTANNGLNDVWSSVDGITWVEETASAAFSARYQPAVFSYNGYMYLVNGKKYGAATPSEIWRSSDGINWTLIDNNPAFGAYAYQTVVSLNGTLYLIGGVNDDDEVNNFVWQTSDVSDWRTLRMLTLDSPQ